MKMRYVYQADIVKGNYMEIVLGIMNRSPCTAKMNPINYMEGVSHRFFLFYGEKVSCQTPEAFVNDLLRLKILTLTH